MEGIVSLLDAAHYIEVEALWADLEREFGLRGVYVTPFPHFSYHVATGYDRSKLEAVLTEFARQQTPFEVTTTGLGIFTGPQPVLYIPVVRSPELVRLHTALWPLLTAVAEGTQDYYSPANWMPHITLAFGDLNPATLADSVRYLSERSFDWRITVDHFAAIVEDGQQGLWRRFPFGG